MFYPDYYNVNDIEDSKKDEYIKNHFATLKESLEIIGVNFVSAMQDAIIIERLMKSKHKT